MPSVMGDHKSLASHSPFLRKLSTQKRLIQEWGRHAQEKAKGCPGWWGRSPWMTAGKEARGWAFSLSQRTEDFQDRDGPNGLADTAVRWEIMLRGYYRVVRINSKFIKKNEYIKNMRQLLPTENPKHTNCKKNKCNTKKKNLHSHNNVNIHHWFNQTVINNLGSWGKEEDAGAGGQRNKPSSSITARKLILSKTDKSTK